MDDLEDKGSTEEKPVIEYAKQDDAGVKDFIANSCENKQSSDSSTKKDFPSIRRSKRIAEHNSR